MSDPSGWKVYGKVSVHFFKGALGLGVGWACWQLNGTGAFAVFTVLAGAFAIAGLGQALWGLVELIRLILRRRRWARYQRQGAKPKADKMADESKLRERGLLR